MLKMTNRLILTTALATSMVYMTCPTHAFEAEIEQDWQVLGHPALTSPIEIQAEVNKPIGPISFQLNSKGEHDQLLSKVPTNLVNSPNAFIYKGDDGKLTASPLFKSMQDPLLRMNDLSYNLAKDNKIHLRMNDAEMTRLKKEGWQIKGFYGLEGRRGTYGDLSGIVCYHPEKNVITVVYHGTAGNADGWGTNFDGERFKAFKIQQEFCKDLFEGALESIKEAKFKFSYGELKSYLSDNLYKETLGLTQAIEAHGKLKLLMSAGEIDPKLARELDDYFTDKIELMKDVETMGVNIPGEIHTGFLKKYLSTRREVLALIKHFMKPGSKVMFTGHSQAGAVAELAQADILVNFGTELLETSLKDMIAHKSKEEVIKELDNKKSGTFSGYFLSAARVGDETFKNWVHDHVGQDQIARQNVNGDPVPVALGDADFAKMLKDLIPAAGEALEKLAGYDDAGHLLLDPGHETWQRAKGIYGQNKVDLSKFDTVDDAISYLASYIVSDAPEFLVGDNKPVGFFSSPIRWVKQRWNTGSMINLLNKARKGDKQALATLEDVLTKRFAHLHYGFDHGVIEGEKVGAAFSPSIVGTDLNKMLEAGRLHEADRLAKKEKSKV